MINETSYNTNRYSFFIKRGEDHAERFEFLNEDGSKCNFSSMRASMYIRPNAYTGSSYMILTDSLNPDKTGIDLSPYSGSVVLPTSSGSLSIQISAATSSLMTYDSAYYHLYLDSSGSIYRIMEGRIKIG